MIRRIFQWSTGTVLLRAAVLIAIIAVADWKVEFNATLGFLYMFPIVLLGTVLNWWQLVIAAVFKLAIVLCVGITASFGLAMLVTRIRPAARVIGARSPRLQARVALPAVEHHRGWAGAEPATKIGREIDAHTVARPGRERAAAAR